MAPLPGLVPARGRGRQALVRHERAHAARSHARARPRLRAGRGSGGRGRSRRTDALALQATALPRGVLAGGVDARRPTDARAQLRLRPLPDGGCDLVDQAAATARDRDERLLVGPARRHERRGPRGVPDVRGPPRSGRRVRDPDRPPLRAGDLRGRGRSAGDARASPVLPVAQPHARGSTRPRADGLPLAGSGADFREFPAATNHQGIVEWPEQARATRTIERERCIVDPSTMPP